MIRLKKFANDDEYEKYSEKLEKNNRNFPYNIVAIIESETHISADVTITCKKKKTAMKRFFEAVKNYPDLMSWDGYINTDNDKDERIIDERHNYMTDRNDYTGNYSIGVDCVGFDNDLWYIFMNISKEYKELTGLQYDYDYNVEKSIEWDKQTETIKESLIKHFEKELGGEWTYKFCNSEETIKNIKIGYLMRDRISGEIKFTFNYTIKTYEGNEENFYMSISTKNGKIKDCYSSNKFRGLIEEAINEEFLNYITPIIPEFNYLPTE